MSFSSQGNSFLVGTKKSQSLVGRDVVCFCGKCRLNLSHTVVTANGNDKPERVQCNTCKSEHAFRGTKSIENSKSRAVEDDSMSERDDEVDLDLDSGGKALLGEAAPKKRAKAKPKAKKSKDDSESKSSSKGGVALPLSMLSASSEDKQLFSDKKAALKASKIAPKDYNIKIHLNVGDVVNHKTFGLGFVMAVGGLNKVEVLFDVGRKLLITGPKP
jgi:DNA-directed RNA polymerase subunit M/transcription elongation factor TFIIS